VFFVTLLVFTIYVIIRRNCFHPHKLLKTS
jgi:hypothetical protein